MANAKKAIRSAINSCANRMGNEFAQRAVSMIEVELRRVGINADQQQYPGQVDQFLKLLKLDDLPSGDAYWQKRCFAAEIKAGKAAGESA